MTLRAEAARRETGLAGGLHVSGPAGEHAGQLMLSGQLAGSRDLQWAGTGANGEPATAAGALHARWRPRPPPAPPPPPPPVFHRSTIRFYDPSTDAWRSTRAEPVNGRVRRFTGRPAAGDTLLASDEEDPPLRWRFTDIGPDSFTWQAEASHD